MWRAVFSLIAAAALTDGDPPGTVTLDLEVGQSKPIEAQLGANMICDDVSVAAPEFAEDGGSGFVLRALRPGTTLCGVWQPEAVPGGLYRVRVASRATNKPDGGAAK